MGKRVTLTVISSLYSEPDNKGKDKLIKRNIKTKMEIDTDLFDMPTEVINSKGIIVKNRCRIHIRDMGPVVVNHSFDEIIKLKQERNIISGFRK